MYFALVQWPWLCWFETPSSKLLPAVWIRYEIDKKSHKNSFREARFHVGVSSPCRKASMKRRRSSRHERECQALLKKLINTFNEWVSIPEVFQFQMPWVIADSVLQCWSLTPFGHHRLSEISSILEPYFTNSFLGPTASPTSFLFSVC